MKPMVLPLASFIVALAANLGLAALVLRRNNRSATNILFALLAIILALWATVNYVSFVTEDYAVALWTIRLVLASAVLQSVTFAMLLNTLPKSILPFSPRGLAVISGLTFLGLLVTLSPFLVTSIDLKPGLVPQPHFSWGMILFVPITIGSLLWGTAALVKRNIKATGVEKIQQRYVLIGLVVTFSLLVTLVLLLSALKGDTRFVPYAPLFTLPSILATSYAIIRHRLLDIRAAIFRTLSLSFLVGAVLGIYGLLLVFAVPIITDLIGIRGEVIAAVAALVSIPLARYVQKTLTRLTDRFLFQNRADYRQALVEIGDQLSGTININDVTS